MAELLSVPEQHMQNWGDALISKDPPWSNTPEYHQWAAQDLTQEKSKEIAQDYGNLAAGAFELGAPFMALGASPIYDTAQAISKYNQEPGKYEVNNKWDKINAYFPDLQGTTVSGILNAIDMENPLSAAYNRMIGAGKPVFNRMFGGMRDQRATNQGLAQVAMQKQIQQAEAAQAQAAANAAAGQRREGRGGSYMSRSRDRGGLGISAAQAQSISDANRAAGMSGWRLSQGGFI